MRERQVVSVYIGDDKEAKELFELLKKVQGEMGLDGKQFWLRAASVFLSSKGMINSHASAGRRLFAYVSRSKGMKNG